VTSGSSASGASSASASGLFQPVQSQEGKLGTHKKKRKTPYTACDEAFADFCCSEGVSFYKLQFESFREVIKKARMTSEHCTVSTCPGN
jgi:hypothetical protein